ncbi:MAG: hypothetical protein Q6358_04145 [Candidatus Brocadiales bacterium]|nr:hypothetical protein [Candidatus Brocadiales bacterium]
MEHVKFVVDETPHACWDWHLQRKNIEFLEGIDSDYFRYAAESNLAGLESEDQQRAALSLRLSYSHGLETLFALLCSMVQAPQCVIGWMISYKNSELRNVVRKITKKENLYSRLKFSPVTWDLLAKHVHFNLGFDEEKLKWIQEGFGQIWKIFADDYLSEGSYQEYNGIKHGLRTRPGGFYFAVGKEDTPGVPAPPEKMQTIEGSEFGTSFFTRETIINNNRINFRPRTQSRNWNPAHLANGLVLLSMSINNILSFLRILNGIKPEKCRINTPTERLVFKEPWKLCLGGTSINIDTTIRSENITQFSKDDILSSYLKQDNSKDNKTMERNAE